MARIVRIFQVDAFTDTRFAGNPAGVVLNAQSLTDSEMLAIARELNNGDTAFVLPATGADHDVHVRFFTPRKEAPFVGHATLAAHAVLHQLQPATLRRQLSKAGIVEVSTLARSAGFSIRQSAPVIGRALQSQELAQVLHLLGLEASHLDPACPPRIAGAASTRLLLGVRDSQVLDSLQPQMVALAGLSAQLGAQGYFVFSRETSSPQLTTQARMFCPALGIDEDPVSGNAHAMLGVYLLEHGLLQTAGASANFCGLQGRHVSRPGRVDVRVTVDDQGKAAAATIAGQAVIVFETSLTL